MDSKYRLLLVDDDPGLCSLMAQFFAENGFASEVARDGRDGLALADRGGFDLVILDVMLPVIDGFEVLRQIRKRSAVPVIMLTARTSQTDRIAGLNSGADDYLPKPFGPEELLARIRAVLRRSGSRRDDAENRVVESGPVRIDGHSREAWLRGERVSVTSIEFDILECLMRSEGRVVSRDALAAVLYQRQSTPYERALDVHISHLRRKLENGKLENGDNEFIRTVRGAGYLFAPGARRSE